MRVFISYCREVETQAASVVSDLEALGHEVWQDQKLSGGQSWWDHILDQIRRCDVFVFALSNATLDSKACGSEYGYAAELGKAILPVMVADDVAPEILPRALASIQVVDHRGSERDGVIRLVQAFQTLPAASPLPDPLPESPEIPISYLGSLRGQIDADCQMDFSDQTALLFRLKQGLRDGDDEELIRDLLHRLRRRNDLLARVGEQIDEVLRETEKESRKVDSIWRPSANAQASEVASAQSGVRRAGDTATPAVGPVEAHFSFPGSYLYGGVGTDHGIRVMLDGRELGRGTVRSGFDLQGETTPGEHVLMIDAVDLGSIRSVMNTLGSSWPVALPVEFPSDGRFRVELIVGKVSVKWKVKRIARV